MISNLEAYSEWKKTTLKRLTARHRAAYMRVIGASLKNVENRMYDSVTTGDQPVLASQARVLQGRLADVLQAHQEDTVHVAVADGIRETAEDLGRRWDDFNVYTEVERTLDDVELAKRNTVATRIARRLRRENGKMIDRLAKERTKDYLAFVRKTFRDLVADYHENEDTDDTADTITKALKTIYKRSDAQAEMMFRTETTRYFNEARVGFFKDNTDVDFVQLVAVTDGRISDICECRDGYVIPIAKAHLKRFMPPFHPNCRTVQSPLDTDLSSDVAEVKKNLGAEFGKQISKTNDKKFTGRRARPPVPLPKGWG